MLESLPVLASYCRQNGALTFAKAFGSSSAARLQVKMSSPRVPEGRSARSSPAPKFQRDDSLKSVHAPRSFEHCRLKNVQRTRGLSTFQRLAGLELGDLAFSLPRSLCAASLRDQFWGRAAARRPECAAPLSQGADREAQWPPAEAKAGAKKAASEYPFRPPGRARIGVRFRARGATRRALAADALRAHP